MPGDRSGAPRALGDRARTGSTRPRREVPRPERPRRLRRSGGTWTSEQIVEAMRAWTDEVGTPPRTYDWAPAIARLGGFATAGAEKWEREHPRWPPHALVRGPFGSWRAALSAAGLPRAAPLRVPRRERVEIAR